MISLNTDGGPQRLMVGPVTSLTVVNCEPVSSISDARARGADAQASARVGPGLATPLVITVHSYVYINKPLLHTPIFK